MCAARGPSEGLCEPREVLGTWGCSRESSGELGMGSGAVAEAGNDPSLWAGAAERALEGCSGSIGGTSRHHSRQKG